MAHCHLPQLPSRTFPPQPDGKHDRNSFPKFAGDYARLGAQWFDDRGTEMVVHRLHFLARDLHALASRRIGRTAASWRGSKSRFSTRGSRARWRRWDVRRLRGRGTCGSGCRRRALSRMSVWAGVQRAARRRWGWCRLARFGPYAVRFQWRRGSGAAGPGGALRFFHHLLTRSGAFEIAPGIPREHDARAGGFDPFESFSLDWFFEPLAAGGVERSVLHGGRTWHPGQRAINQGFAIYR